MKARFVILFVSVLAMTGCGHGSSNATNATLGLSKTEPVSASTAAKQFTPTAAPAMPASTR